jgi:hypothetical protein
VSEAALRKRQLSLLIRQWVQDVDGITQVEPLPSPTRCRRVRVDAESKRIVPCAQLYDRIGGHRGRCRDDGEHPALWRAERQIAARFARHLIAFLVNCAVMPPTERREIRERRRPAMRPVPDVMALAKPRAAAGEAAALIAVMQRPSEGRRDCSRSRADLRDAAVGVVSHDHAACVAGKALRRFRRDAGAVDNRLTGRIRIG